MDYLSPTLYLLDGLWLVLFLISFWSKRKKGKKEKIGWAGLLVGINIFLAKYRWLAVYKWLRVGQLWWMGRYLISRKKWLKEDLKKILPIWIVVESWLGLAQIMKGGSLEGIFYWLGERRFSYSTIGVAQISWMGKGLIRAYGTFSHPNSLAGFLLVAMLMWIGMMKNEKKVGWLRGGMKWVVLWSGVLGIIMAGSRMVWAVSLGILIFNSRSFIFKNNKKKQWGFYLILLGVILIALAGVGVNYVVGDFLGGWDRIGLSKRMGLNWAAIKMIMKNPLLGVGLGNFLVNLPEFQKNAGYYWLQPVHNILLLLITEIGFLGTYFFYRWIKKIEWRKKLSGEEKWIWLVILATGMVDHYWLTLPQNGWIFLVFLVGLVR